MMRFLAEIKRRKVIQTAVLYAVAAWGLLQVAELLLDMLDVPPWGLKLVFALLLLGFTLALLLSWMNRITGKASAGRMRHRRFRADCRRPMHLRRRMGAPPPSQCR